MHWRIATLAVESGISPLDLLQLEPRMLWTIEKYLIGRAKNQNKAMAQSRSSPRKRR